MTRFLNGLNRDIANVVELQHCVESEDMVHMTTKVERQINKRGSPRFQTNLASSSSTWRLNLKREGAVQPKPYAKAEPPNAKKDAHTDWKGKSESEPTRDRDIKYFKCLGKWHNTSQCPNHGINVLSYILIHPLFPRISNGSCQCIGRCSIIRYSWCYCRKYII